MWPSNLGCNFLDSTWRDKSWLERQPADLLHWLDPENGVGRLSVGSNHWSAGELNRLCSRSWECDKWREGAGNPMLGRWWLLDDNHVHYIQAMIKIAKGHHTVFIMSCGDIVSEGEMSGRLLSNMVVGILKIQLVNMVPHWNHIIFLVPGNQCKVSNDYPFCCWSCLCQYQGNCYQGHEQELGVAYEPTWAPIVQSPSSMINASVPGRRCWEEELEGVI